MAVPRCDGLDIGCDRLERMTGSENVEGDKGGVMSSPHTHCSLCDRCDRLIGYLKVIGKLGLTEASGTGTGVLKTCIFFHSFQPVNLSHPLRAYQLPHSLTLTVSIVLKPVTPPPTCHATQ